MESIEYISYSSYLLLMVANIFWFRAELCRFWNPYYIFESDCVFSSSAYTWSCIRYSPVMPSFIYIESFPDSSDRIWMPEIYWISTLFYYFYRLKSWFFLLGAIPYFVMIWLLGWNFSNLLSFSYKLSAIVAAIFWLILVFWLFLCQKLYALLFWIMIYYVASSSSALSTNIFDFLASGSSNLLD